MGDEVVVEASGVLGVHAGSVLRRGKSGERGRYGRVCGESMAESVALLMAARQHFCCSRRHSRGAVPVGDCGQEGREVILPACPTQPSCSKVRSRDSTTQRL